MNSFSVKIRPCIYVPKYGFRRVTLETPFLENHGQFSMMEIKFSTKGRYCYCCLSAEPKQTEGCFGVQIN